MQPSLHWVYGGVFKHLWGQFLVTLLWLQENKFQEGKLGCVQHMQLFLCARRDLGGTSRPLRELLSAWYKGHVHQLAHGAWYYAETHGWPEASNHAQHYWVSTELLTDNPWAFQSLITVQNQLNRPLSHPTPFSLFKQLRAHTQFTHGYHLHTCG